MAKRYPGVRARNNSVQVDLTVSGRRVRFSLPIPPNNKSLSFASELRAAAKLEIARGTFKAKDFFPHTKSRLVQESQTPSVRDALVEFLKHAERRLSPSTHRDYSSAAFTYLIPQFGEFALNELTAELIRSWIHELQISPKRINNVLVPLRSIYSEAYEQGLIDINPLSRIRNLKTSTSIPEPFTLDEIGKILEASEGTSEDLFEFAFWTGLRTSELIALTWADIDLENSKVHVNKAEVRGITKGTKTESGHRVVQLLKPARNALKRSKANSSNSWNRVFMNPKTGRPWSSDGQIRKTAWAPALKRAGIPYRRPYQTRHTYASQMLTMGADPMWVAQQMGHRDWGMIRKVYGRWIKESRPDIEQKLEAQLAQIRHMDT